MSSPDDIGNLISVNNAPDVEDYFNIVDNLNFKEAGNFTISDSVVEQQFTNFLFEIYSGNDTSPRQSYNDFLDAFKQYIDDKGADGDYYRTIVNAAFYYCFSGALGLPSNINSDLGDYETLYQALGASGTRSEFILDQLDNFVSYFLRYYDFSLPDSISSEDNPFGDLQGGSPPSIDWTNEFATAFSKFATTRAYVDDTLGSLENVNLATYQNIFNEFVGDNPDQSFEEVLGNFYQAVVARDGYFSPSQQLKDWFKVVQVQRIAEAGLATSVQGTNSSKTDILLIIFKLLVQVIDVLQRVAAAQGDRLRFYANYQKAYTDLIKQVPIITEEDIRIILTKNSDTGSVREQVFNFTQSTSQSYTEKLRAFRSAIGDEAKQHQTTVNQSNEIVSQQANLGSSLLQEMSTILTSIFK